MPKDGRWWLLAAAMICLVGAAAALAVDLPLARWFRTPGVGGEIRRLLTVAEVFAYGGGVILIALTAATLDPRGYRVLAYLLTSSLGAGLSADLLKLTMTRGRPSTGIPETVAETFIRQTAEGIPQTAHAWQSFPSAHTATAVGLACALSVCYPRGRMLFAFFACLAACQRLQSQAHFLSDVCAGAAIGFCWVWLNDGWPIWKTWFVPPTAEAGVTASPSAIEES